MNMNNQKFVGSWELQQWTTETSDGRIEFPFGEDAIGLITYELDGIMSVQIMKNDRPQFLSEDPLQGQPDEIATAYTGFIAYCGKYEIHHDSNLVVHQIKISSFPNWVGQNQIRQFAFNEDTLILSTDLIGLNKHRLVWKKLPSN